MPIARQMFAAILIAVNGVSMASAQVAPLVLQQGAPVALKTRYELDINSVKPGDRFQFLLANHLTVNGVVVVPAGTPGTGEIVSIKHNGGFGHAGKIETRPLYVDYQGYHITLDAPEPPKPQKAERKAPRGHAYSYYYSSGHGAGAGGGGAAAAGVAAIGVIAASLIVASMVRGASGSLAADAPIPAVVQRTMRLTPAGTPAPRFAAQELPQPGFSSDISLNGAEAAIPLP